MRADNLSACVLYCCSSFPSSDRHPGRVSGIVLGVSPTTPTRTTSLPGRLRPAVILCPTPDAYGMGVEVSPLHARRFKVSFFSVLLLCATATYCRLLIGRSNAYLERNVTLGQRFVIALFRLAAIVDKRPRSGIRAIPSVGLSSAPP